MKLPGGTPLWEDLKLWFINLKELLLYLKSIEFSGTIHFYFDSGQGLILFLEGDVVMGLKKNKDRWERGYNLAEEILETSHRKKQARLDITTYPAESIEILADIFNLPVYPIYKGLSSEFTNMGHFIDQLRKIHFTGYLEICPEVGEDDSLEMVLFTEGSVTALVSKHFHGRISEKKATDMRRISLYARQLQSRGVMFNLFTTSTEPEFILNGQKI